MEVICRKCGQPKTVGCTQQQLDNWKRGQLIQKAMPNVPAGERELLISGYCDDCWQKLFPPEVEEGGEGENDMFYL